MFLDKYEIVFESKRRYYVEDLSERDFNLENTIPHLLKINDYEIFENKWTEMLRMVVLYLITTYPEYKDKLLNFKTEWSKSNIFYNSLGVSNLKQIDKNLYVNCNHTALHSCWLIQDLLTFFEIDLNSVYFLIHRSPIAEPTVAKEYFSAKFKNEFTIFLKLSKNKSDDNSNKIISNIEKIMNPILGKISKSYNSFFLFDDNLLFYNYSVKFIEFIDKNYSINIKNKEIMKRYIMYMREFYKI